MTGRIRERQDLEASLSSKRGPLLHKLKWAGFAVAAALAAQSAHANDTVKAAWFVKDISCEVDTRLGRVEALVGGGVVSITAKPVESDSGEFVRVDFLLYMPLVHDGRCWFNGFAPGSYLGKRMTRQGLVSHVYYIGGKGIVAEKWKDVSWDMLGLYVREHASEFNSADTDLSAFRAHGGKIMMTLGWEDQTVPPAPILDYYEQVCERDGGIDRTREYFRLFCLPGCAHGGGTGRATTGSTNNAGIRKQLTDWREKGIAPEKMVSNWRSAGIALPVAPYPGLYVKDADGSWRVRDVKRGVARIDASVRKTDRFPKTPKQKNKENIK